MSLLEVKNLSHARGDKILYTDASFELHHGDHMGIVGRNGAGKSTLIAILSGEALPDKGLVRWQPGIRLGLLDQYAAVNGGLSVRDYLGSAFADLYALEKELEKAYAACAEDPAALKRAARLQSRLEAADFYAVDTRVGRVAEGLGLPLEVPTPLSRLSGGQRARAILGKLLLEEPEVLLLDEPTNFLDAEHVDWLAEFLAGFPNAFAAVSHDRAFLERVATCICDIEGGTVRRYNSGYSAFLKQKGRLEEDHARRYREQQQKIAREEEFIRRNIAGIKSRMAKGRRKHLERLERIAPPPAVPARPDIRFTETPLPVREALTVRNLSVGYGYPLLSGLNLTVGGSSKIAVTGFNGIGKSTLLRTLIGEIPALGGTCLFAEAMKIGYYRQEMRWPDGRKTPLRILSDALPALTPRELRRLLASYGLAEDRALLEVGLLSGGEQARLRLCILAAVPCNFLVLDEPTGHLDAPARDALREALIRFQGGILLVSHDLSFCRGWIGRVIDVESLAAAAPAGKAKNLPQSRTEKTS